MLQMHLHEQGVMWRLIEGEDFCQLKNVLDNTMKECTTNGLGLRQSSAVITFEQETEFFSKGLLGEETPAQLLKTVIYMLGLHLALRGGVEHERL